MNSRPDTCPPKAKPSAETGTTCSPSPRDSCGSSSATLPATASEASVVMGRIRSALRAYALLELPPEEVLRLVDRKVDHFELGTIATVACAVADPPYDTFDRRPRRASTTSDLNPGRTCRGRGHSSRSAARLRVGYDHTSTTLPITPGTTVVLYTDGLVERRGESIDVGIERLRAAISHAHPREATAELMHQLVGQNHHARRHRLGRVPKSRNLYCPSPPRHRRLNPMEHPRNRRTPQVPQPCWSSGGNHPRQIPRSRGTYVSGFRPGHIASTSRSCGLRAATCSASSRYSRSSTSRHRRSGRGRSSEATHRTSGSSRLSSSPQT